MSNTSDDERSLLEAIRDAVGSYSLEARISSLIIPYTSYILKNVAAFKLNGLKKAVPNISEERVSESTVAEFDFIKYDFHDIGIILKEIERAIPAELDENMFAISLLKILEKGNYTLNFILVGPLAAFAVSHGVWLLILKFICADSSEGNITMVLKKIEGLFLTLRRNLEKGVADYHLDYYIYISLLSSSVTRQPRDNWKSLDSLYKSIEAMFEVVSVAQSFLKDVVKFIPKNLKDEFDNLILISIYWVMRSVYVCSSQCNSLPKNGFVIQDPQVLIDIHNELISIYGRLQTLYDTGKQYIDDEKIVKTYQIPNKNGPDNYYALTALLGLRPNVSQDVKLSHCSKKNMDIPLVTLRRKTLILLISDLDISSHLISLLEDIYSAIVTSVQQENCEFIWLPIHNGPWTTFFEEQYTKLSQRMPWYTVFGPASITENTRKFIKNVWKFHMKPIVVVLNESGDVVCPNAIYMMCIWGAKAFPFTKMRERTLWKDETSVKTLVLGFDSRISRMLEASKWVILYGGTNIGWIRKFLTCVRVISADSGGMMEMIYAGKHMVLPDSPQNYSLNPRKIWYFWIRLESILISRYQMISASDYAMDTIILEVKRLLSYASAESWACLITPSSDVMIHDLGDTILEGFMEYNSWKQNVHEKDFNKIFQNYIDEQSRMSDHPCSHIVLDIDNKDVIQSLECPYCHEAMEKKIQYKCCHKYDD